MISERMLRAARLDNNLYDEVEHDTNATTQALIVVVIVAIATGIGGALGQRDAALGFVSGVILSVIWWLVWSYITYFIGTRLFSGVAAPGELLRTIDFAQAPGVLRIFSFIPVLGGLINLVVVVWLLIAGIIAIRQALDFDTTKAILTAIVGWLVMVVITALLAILGFGFVSALNM